MVLSFTLKFFYFDQPLNWKVTGEYISCFAYQDKGHLAFSSVLFVAVVYEVLYKCVFGVEDCVSTSRAMISSKGRRRDSTCSDPDIKHDSWYMYI